MTGDNSVNLVTSNDLVRIYIPFYILQTGILQTFWSVKWSIFKISNFQGQFLTLILTNVQNSVKMSFKKYVTGLRGRGVK